MLRYGSIVLFSGMQAAAGVPIGGTVGELVPTELPGPGFPGSTASLSNMAWPLSQRQPGRFDTWPQLGYGTANRTLLPCWKPPTVLHDHANGWPGLCMDLMDAGKYSTEEGCRKLCWNEPRCAVWQFVNQTNPGQCWVGFGQDCAWRDGRPNAISVQGAQRIMHGKVRVLKNLTGWKINKLFKLGMYHAGDEHLSILRCKAWCYSDISCQYWQYGPGGCWVDAPRWSATTTNDVNNRVQYPLTTNGGASNSSAEALTMMWGEYIQHYCPPQHTTPTPMLQVDPLPLLQTTAAPSSGAFSEWWLWALMAVAICLGGGACAYFIMAQGQGGQKRGLKSSRAGRVAMSDYGEEDSPLVSSPPKQRQRPPSDDYQAAAAAPTADYLNIDRPQDYQQWQQPPPQGAPQRSQYSGGMPETQNFADASQAAGRWQSNQMQGMAPPTQLVDMVQQHHQAMSGYQSQNPYQQNPYQQNPYQQPYQQGGMPYPGARPGMPTMQGMQPPTARLM